MLREGNTHKMSDCMIYTKYEIIENLKSDINNFIIERLGKLTLEEFEAVSTEVYDIINNMWNNKE